MLPSLPALDIDHYSSLDGLDMDDLLTDIDLLSQGPCSSSGDLTRMDGTASLMLSTCDLKDDPLGLGDFDLDNLGLPSFCESQTELTECAVGASRAFSGSLNNLNQGLAATSTSSPVAPSTPSSMSQSHPNSPSLSDSDIMMGNHPTSSVWDSPPSSSNNSSNGSGFGPSSPSPPPLMGESDTVYSGFDSSDSLWGSLMEDYKLQDLFSGTAEFNLGGSSDCDTNRQVLRDPILSSAAEPLMSAMKQEPTSSNSSLFSSSTSHMKVSNGPNLNEHNGSFNGPLSSGPSTQNGIPSSVPAVSASTSLATSHNPLSAPSTSLSHSTSSSSVTAVTSIPSASASSSSSCCPMIVKGARVQGGYTLSSIQPNKGRNGTISKLVGSTGNSKTLKAALIKSHKLAVASSPSTSSCSLSCSYPSSLPATISLPCTSGNLLSSSTTLSSLTKPAPALPLTSNLAMLLRNPILPTPPTTPSSPPSSMGGKSLSLSLSPSVTSSSSSIKKPTTTTLFTVANSSSSHATTTLSFKATSGSHFNSTLTPSSSSSSSNQLVVQTVNGNRLNVRIPHRITLNPGPHGSSTGNIILTTTSATGPHDGSKGSSIPSSSPSPSSSTSSFTSSSLSPSTSTGSATFVKSANHIIINCPDYLSKQLASSSMKVDTSSLKGATIIGTASGNGSSRPSVLIATTNHNLVHASGSTLQLHNKRPMVSAIHAPGSGSGAPLSSESSHPGPAKKFKDPAPIPIKEATVLMNLLVNGEDIKNGYSRSKSTSKNCRSRPTTSLSMSSNSSCPSTSSSLSPPFSASCSPLLIQRSSTSGNISGASVSSTSSASPSSSSSSSFSSGSPSPSSSPSFFTSSGSTIFDSHITLSPFDVR